MIVRPGGMGSDGCPITGSANTRLIIIIISADAWSAGSCNHFR